MSKFESVSEELGHAWYALVSGWRKFYDRAAGALTQFSRHPRKGELQPTDDQEIALRSCEWGLLAAEVFDADDKIVVRLEAPGMDREDFDLQVVDDYLIVRGQKKIERERSDGQYHICECAYGSFERAVPLPESVAVDRANAKYKRGVLRVELPKRHGESGKKLSLKLE